MHLHYATNQEALLGEVVFDNIDYFEEALGLRRWFYIRYNGGEGPHIRLRLEVEDINTKYAKLMCEDLIGQQYMQANPSVLDAADKAAWKATWKANNIVVRAEYEPEYDRYGGKEGVDIAESLFHLNTLFCESVMRDFLNSWSEEKAMSCGLLSQVILVRCAGMNKKEAVHFLTGYARLWLPSVIVGTHSQKDLDDAWGAFEDAFEQQKESLIETCDNLWEYYSSGVNSNVADQEDTIYDYIESLLAEYVEGLLNGKIEARAKAFKNPHFAHIAPARRELYELVSDLMHLNFNRLGLPNNQEAYSAFLLSKALEA